MVRVNGFGVCVSHGVYVGHGGECRSGWRWRRIEVMVVNEVTVVVVYRGHGGGGGGA